MSTAPGRYPGPRGDACTLRAAPPRRFTTARRRPFFVTSEFPGFRDLSDGARDHRERVTSIDARFFWGGGDDCDLLLHAEPRPLRSPGLEAGPTIPREDLELGGGGR